MHAMNPTENQNIEEVIYKPRTRGHEDATVKLERNRQHRDTFYLYFSAFTANLIIFVSGSTLVWSSPVLSRLQSNNTEENPLEYPITSSETSLIAGLPYLGGFIGPLISGRLCDSLGRKKTLLVLAVSKIVSYIALAFSKHIYLYYFARTILGLGFFSTMSILTIYLTEISENHNRGKYVCFMGVALVSGNLYAFVLGHLFSIQVFTLLCCVPAVISFIPTLLLLPESPIFLVSKNREAEAIKALQKLRGRCNVNTDIDEIKKIIKESETSTKAGWTSLFEDAVLRRSFIIGTGCLFLQAFSGVAVILSYMGPIFDSIGISGNIVAALVGSLKLSMYFLASGIVEKYGRRLLMLISASTTGFALFFIGLAFCLKQLHIDLIDKIPWLPAVGVFLFVITYSIGLGPLPMAIVGEVFTGDIKALAMSIIMIFFAFFSFLVTSCFPFIVEWLGIYWAFWLFAVISWSGVAFVYFIVPETKGRSFLDIQDMIKNRTK